MGSDDGVIEDGVIEIALRGLDTDVTLVLRGPGAAGLLGEVRRVWRRCLRPGGALPGRPVVVDVPADADHGALLDRLAPQVTQAVIEAQAGRLLMLHAAGLADPTTGDTWALVAPSGTGKTTAARHLGRELGYLTDETVGVRSDGTIAAYPKPLSVIRPGEPHKVQEPPYDGAPVPETCRLAGLLVLDRDGTEETVVDRLSVVRGLAALAPETSFLARLPRPLHLLAEHIDRAGGVRVVHYREAAQVGAVIEELRSKTR